MEQNNLHNMVFDVDIYLVEIVVLVLIVVYLVEIVLLVLIVVYLVDLVVEIVVD